MNLVLSNLETWDSLTEEEVDNHPNGKTSQQR